MAWTKRFGDAWLVDFKQISDTHYLYMCKRPKDYAYKSRQFPWGHVYVMEGTITDDTEGRDIEHFVLHDESPLEIECIVIEMQKKYEVL